MEFEIVTHCLHYPKLLSFQLSSLVLNPPSEAHAVKYTLCFTASDDDTARTVDFFAQKKVPGIAWNWVEMPARALHRRSIGRNLAALATTADWVWFADADYCFGESCFSMLAERALAQKGPLIYPRRVRATTLEGGDELIKEASTNPAIRVVPEDYWTESIRYRYAVGGVQIVRGWACRENGYVRDQPYWQREADYWKGCKEDRVFRECLGTRGAAIDLPPVYRIRHTAKGRFDVSVRL